MATYPTKRKPATQDLLDRFSNLIDEQSKKMDDEQFRKAEEKFNQVINQARASRRKRPENA